MIHSAGKVIYTRGRLRACILIYDDM